MAEQTGGYPVIPEIRCDGELTLADVTADTVQWLERLEPFGTGNPAPRFLCENVKPLSLRAVGAEGRHLKCTFQQGKEIRDGIFFGGGNWAGQTGGLLRLVLSPTLNEFRGNISPECRLYAMQFLPESLTDDPEREALSLFSDEITGQKAVPLAEDELDALMAGGQGTLLLCRCRETALRMRAKYPDADFCLGKADDPRAFHTVLLYGSAAAVSAPFRRIVLCDGDAGEAAAWLQAFPEARVSSLPRTEALGGLLKHCFVDVDGLRACYAALRRRLPYDIAAFAGAMKLTAGQAAFALRALAEIGLITVSFSPFRVEMLPMRKRGPEDSSLFLLARHAKEG